MKKSKINFFQDFSSELVSINGFYSQMVSGIEKPFLWFKWIQN